MNPTDTTEGAGHPGAPERRLAAAEKQLRIVREIAGEGQRDIGVQIEAAIDEVERARSLLE